MSDQTSGLRTIVYIDGFNLYYRCLKYTLYKWLDIESFCNNLLAPLSPRARIVSIKYFTSNIKDKTSNTKAAERQIIYLKALSKQCSNLEIIKGKYQVQNKKRLLAQELPCQHDTPCHESNLIKVVLPEEKQTDVNIAAQMINDAWLNLYDQAVLISSDTDLSPALDIVHTDYPGKPKKLIGLCGNSMRSKANNDLLKHADWYRVITEEHLINNQLPENIANNIRKPEAWSHCSHNEFSNSG